MNSNHKNIIFYIYVKTTIPVITKSSKVFKNIFISHERLEVSMLNHTYPHKPLRKIKVTTCNHQADSPLYVWSDV